MDGTSLKHSQNLIKPKKLVGMSKNENPVWVSFFLEGEDAKQFNQVKDRKGLKNAVELVRLLVKEGVERVLKA